MLAKIKDGYNQFMIEQFGGVDLVFKDAVTVEISNAFPTPLEAETAYPVRDQITGRFGAVLGKYLTPVNAYVVRAVIMDGFHRYCRETSSRPRRLSEGDIVSISLSSMTEYPAYPLEPEQIYRCDVGAQYELIPGAYLKPVTIVSAE